MTHFFARNKSLKETMASCNIYISAFPAQIAFCGETFDLTFNLPFIDFVPATVPVKFFIRVSAYTSGSAYTSEGVLKGSSLVRLEL